MTTPKRSRKGRSVASTRGGPDQGKAWQGEFDRPGTGSLANNNVQLKIFHGRVENFFDNVRQSVNLVDEKNIALLQVGEQRCQVTGAFHDRPRRTFEVDPISTAMICASVVFPSPGGPQNRM